MCRLHIRQKPLRVGSALLLRIANRLRPQNLLVVPNFMILPSAARSKEPRATVANPSEVHNR